MLDLVFLRDRLDDARARLRMRGEAAVRRSMSALRSMSDGGSMVTELEALKSEHNAANAAIPELKRTGTPEQFQAAREAGKARGERIRALEAELAAIETTRDELLLNIPNLPHASVPAGRRRPTTSRCGSGARGRCSRSRRSHTGSSAPRSASLISSGRPACPGARFSVLLGRGCAARARAHQLHARPACARARI